MPDVDVEGFFKQHFTVERAKDELTTAGARAFTGYLESSRSVGATLLWARAGHQMGGEVVAVEIEVPLGQRPVINDILPTEPIAFVFGDGAVPAPYALRAGFPNTLPHMNLAPERLPNSLCLFEMTQEEILRILSPSLLLERTRLWLRESAYGRLHRDDQPLDPVFGGRSIQVISRSRFADEENAHVLAFRVEDTDGAPVLMDRNDRLPELAGQEPGFVCLSITTPAVQHGRMNALPTTIAQLFDTFRSLGVELGDLMAPHFERWCGETQPLERFKKRGILRFSTPILRSPDEIGGYANNAFITIDPIGDLAEAMGVIIRDGETVGRALSGTADSGALGRLTIEPATIHRGFDRSLAEISSGSKPSEKPLRILQAGCGALGSQLALAAARSGIGQWTFVDPDHLMPHNMARHALGPEYIGYAKTSGMAHAVTALLGPDAATGAHQTVQSYISSEGIPDFDLVLDASASVSVARDLAVREDMAIPVVSAFLNPSGEDLVAMREASDRSIRLDHLEMDYYWRLVQNADLVNHLHKPGTFLPANGCRQPSAQIAQSDVMRASAEAVALIFEEDGLTEGSVEVRANVDTGRRSIKIDGSRYTEVVVGGWTIAVSEDVLARTAKARAVAAPNETGGIVVGAWDRRLRKGYIVAVLDAPPDSIASTTGFERGSVGVWHELTHITEVTAANLNYVGEWHTHPPQHGSNPSGDDTLLMQWIDEEVTLSDVPAIMLIAGDDGVRFCVRTTSDCTVLRHAKAGND